MVTYPNIVRGTNSIEIELGPHSEYIKQIEVEFILDKNQFDDVIGIEILDLKLEAGVRCLGRVESCIEVKGNGLRYGYDEETDSFYLQISNEDSSDQESINGILVLNSESQIVCFSARN